MQTDLFGQPASEIAKAIKDWEQVQCPVCGTEPSPFATDYQGFQLCRCSGCQLEFLSPRPAYAELNENVYNETYFEEESRKVDVSPSQLAQFSGQLETMERLLHRRGTMLDVGCGTGSFLRFAMQRGWTGAGIDVVLAKAARDVPCPLWEGRLDEVDFGQQRFDVIRFNHVLEHTQDPVKELKRARELLTPGGIVFVSVPNLAGVSTLVKNLQSRLHLKNKIWRHYAAVHHLWFFKPKTLAATFEAAGLRVLRWETPVLKKPGQGPAAEFLYRQLFEKPRLASILDFYATGR